MENTNLTPEQSDKLNYDGELTLEALATLDAYTKQCCNVSATSKKLNKQYLQVRRFLKQPYVREIFQLKLLEKGVTPDRIASVINQGIDAVDKENNPDWLSRHRFVQLAAEIYEVLKYNSKGDTNNFVSNKNYVIFRNPDAVKEECNTELPAR